MFFFTIQNFSQFLNELFLHISEKNILNKCKRDIFIAKIFFFFFIYERITWLQQWSGSFLDHFVSVVKCQPFRQTWQTLARKRRRVKSTGFSASHRSF